MRLCEPIDTCRDLAISGHSLGIKCRCCERRIVLTARQLRVHEGDYSALIRIPPVCSCRRCSARMYLIETPTEAQSFLSRLKPQAA